MTRIAAALAAIALFAAALVHPDNTPLGESVADKTLVYFVQTDGSRRHLFSRQEWLGILEKDAYFFTHLDPGEHFVWTGDARAFTTFYAAPGSTIYLQVSQKKITVADPTTGETLLTGAVALSMPGDADRSDSSAKLRNYRKAYLRALRAGLFEPCLFASEKRAEYDRRVKAGDPQASHIQGNLYWYGECVDRDFPTAISWYKDAAGKGHIGAMVTLGNIYYRGTNVEEDPEESAVWYLMAAEKGDLFSQRRLAEMYRQGHGVEADPEEAIKWYRRAVEEGNDQWSLIQLEAIDPEIQERKRQETEAKERAAKEKKRKLEEQRQRIRERRLTRISGKYDELALNVIPLGRKVKLEPPRRKKPEDDGNAMDSNVAYMLPPEIALGVVALSLVFNAVERSLDSRLSSEERAQIESAAAGLTRMLSEEPVADGLTQQIVSAGELPGGESLFDLEPGAEGVDTNANNDGVEAPAPDMVLDVETTGIGLMLADKRYRKSHLVMANHIRLRRKADGIVLKDRSLCYASKDTPNFTQWAADEGKRIREAMNAAYTHTAETILLILADEAYSTNSRNNELCKALLVTVEARKAALAEPDR